MDNFDFTQFITFDSALPYGIIKNNIESIFIKKRFSVVDFKDIEKVKKDYEETIKGKDTYIKELELSIKELQEKSNRIFSKLK